MTTHTLTIDANVFSVDGHEPTEIELRAKAYRPAGWPVPLGGDDFAVKNILIFTVDPDDPTVVLEATGGDWCWQVGLHHPEVPDSAWERYFFLTADTNFMDLVDLDPTTLDPAAEPAAAWYVELDNRVPSAGTTGHVLTKGAGGSNTWEPAAAGAGDVVGPAASVDNRVVRMDGITGKLIQESPVTIDDAGAMTGMTTVDGRDLSVDGTKLDGIASGATANATNAQLRDRATHTGTQPANTITGLAAVATSGDYDDLTDKPTALPPSGAAGGVLSGTYPNPGFADDMATQVELDAHINDPTDAHDGSAISIIESAYLPGATNLQNFFDTYAAPFLNQFINYWSSKMVAKGDLVVGTAVGQTPDRLPVGANGSRLVADSAETTGMRWDATALQPSDADLTAIAALNPATANVIASDGAGWIAKTYAQLKTALGLVKGDVGLGNVDNVQQQPLDADLTTIAGLTATTDNVIQSVGSAWASRTPSQLKATLALVKGDVGLGNVDNTSDATKNAAVATLTNKRITKRVSTVADTATLTIASDDYDGAKVTALAQAMTIAAPTGTPTAMQSLIIRIKDNGTARALTWNAAFRAVGVTLPTTTVLSKTVYVGAIWNSDDSVWDAIAVAQQA